MLNFAQLATPAPQDWWWSTMTSRPAMLLIAVAAGCLMVLLFMGWRLSRVTAPQRSTSMRERLSNDSGVAMIEFVLVTPILLIITLILIQTVLVFTGLFYVQYSAFAAARSAIVQIPLEGDQPRNYIVVSRGADKFDSIESAAIFAVLPVCGRESGSSFDSGDLVAGLRNVYQAQGKNEPAWVENMLAQRLSYAINHTTVELEKVTPGAGTQPVNFQEVSGLVRFSDKEAIGVRVRHEFALSIPLASRIFALAGNSGSYSPASIEGDSPAPPGQWTVIESRAILTNEGIKRTLPDAPTVPRI